MTIHIMKRAGSFAENKDVARDIRVHEITPAVEAGKQIILDFEGVTGATQSFIHALISEVIRDHGDSIYDNLLFRNCTPPVEQVVNIVADYMQER